MAVVGGMFVLGVAVGVWFAIGLTVVEERGCFCGLLGFFFGFFVCVEIAAVSRFDVFESAGCDDVVAEAGWMDVDVVDAGVPGSRSSAVVALMASRAGGFAHGKWR